MAENSPKNLDAVEEVGFHLAMAETESEILEVIARIDELLRNLDDDSSERLELVKKKAFSYARLGKIEEAAPLVEDAFQKFDKLKANQMLEALATYLDSYSGTLDRDASARFSKLAELASNPISAARCLAWCMDRLDENAATIFESVREEFYELLGMCPIQPGTDTFRSFVEQFDEEAFSFNERVDGPEYHRPSDYKFAYLRARTGEKHLFLNPWRYAEHS